jgi:thioredoxin-related protein
MNDSANPQDERKVARMQRWSGVGLTIAMIGLVYLCVKLFPILLAPVSTWIRIPAITIVTLLAALPLYFGGHLLHRKWTTGRFLLTFTELVAKRKANLDKYGPDKPFWPQAGYILSQVLVVVFFLSLAALFYGFWRSDTINCLPKLLSYLLLGLIVLPLTLPCWILYKTIARKLKTGSFLVTRAEIVASSARCAKPAKRWQGILSAEMNVLAAAMFTVNSVLHFMRHHSLDIQTVLLPLVWWFLAAVWIKRAIRPVQLPKALTCDPDDAPVPAEEPLVQPLKRRELAGLIALPIVLAVGYGFLIAHVLHQSPGIYPPATQARANLSAALQAASSNHKRILLDFGESSCPDCQTLDRYFHDANNQSIVESNFIHVLVNIDNGDSNDSRNANQNLADRYSIPLDKGYPALAVLDEKGELIFSQKNGEFADMRHLKSADLTNFLLRWKQ